MAIDAKELMQAPRFEGYGSFVAARPANGDWKASYLFECFGGQVNVEVEESETITVPPVDATFFIAGHVRYSPRNGTIALIAEEKKFVAEVPAEQYINGMTIKGVGIVEAKESSTMNRQTFLSVTIKWFGGLHKFRKLTPEVFQRIFGEIWEVFESLCVNLGKESGLVFPKLRGYRHRIELAIRAAGVEVWEKLFVNLRSSCITDLAERGYSEKTLDAIFGNSAAVRSLHYVQFRGEREYSRVLSDDERLSKSGELENELLLRLVGVSGGNLEEVLALRDLLVGRFGAGKRAG